MSLFRRAVAALLITSAVLTGAVGCGKGKSGDWRSRGPTAEASATPDDVGLGEAATFGSEGGGSCTDVKKVVAAGTPIFNEISKVTNSPPDAAQQGATLTKIKKDLTGWAGQVRAQAPKVKNSTLKQALTDMATGIDEATAEFVTFPDLDHASLTFDSPRLNQSRQKVKAICK